MNTTTIISPFNASNMSAMLSKGQIVATNLSGMSDVQLINQFCSSFGWFNAAMMGIIFLLILGRALIFRQKRLHPEESDYQRAFDALDGLVEMFTVAFIVLSFLSWLFF